MTTDRGLSEWHNASIQVTGGPPGNGNGMTSAPLLPQWPRARRADLYERVIRNAPTSDGLEQFAARIRESRGTGLVSATKILKSRHAVRFAGSALSARVVQAKRGRLMEARMKNERDRIGGLDETRGADHAGPSAGYAAPGATPRAHAGRPVKGPDTGRNELPETREPHGPAGDDLRARVRSDHGPWSGSDRRMEESKGDASKARAGRRGMLRTRKSGALTSIWMPALAIVSMALAASSCAHVPFQRSPESRLRDDVLESRMRYAPAPPPIAEQGSLWSEVATVSLVGDTRAYRPGDLVTINIVEDTKGTQQATTDLTKDATLSLKAPVLGGYENRLTNKFPNFNPAQILDTSTNKAFKGDGATTRETSVVAAVTARVLGVYPNGDLAILGHKDVEVNHERQVLTLVGIVRAEDLSSENSVSSDRIAELGVHLGGRGDINDAQREGWLSRLIQKVWPF